MVVMFGVGDEVAFVDVPIVDDNVLEVLETFSASLTSLAPNVVVDIDSGSATVTILDNDSKLTKLIAQG